MSNRMTHAIEDFQQSLARSKLWLYLGWSDIKLRYRGSVLGPLWITLSMAIFVVVFGFVYGALLHQDPKAYIPFLTVGILIWNYISAIAIESCDAFLSAKNIISQIKLSYLIHIYRIIWRNIIVLFHNSLVFILVSIYFAVSPTLDILYFIPGFILLTINLSCLSLFLSVVACRYRDLVPVTTSLIQVAFFVSPITWLPGLLGKNSFVITWNPIYYFFDIVRSPLLGQAPTMHSWLVCIAITLFTLTLSSAVFVMNRNKIPFWV